MKQIFRALPAKVAAFILTVAAGTATLTVLLMVLISYDGIFIVGSKGEYYSVELYNGIVTAGIVFLISVILLVYLLAVSGRKAGSDEMYSAPLNKVPFDLFAAIAAAGMIVCCLLAYYIIENSTHYINYLGNSAYQESTLVSAYEVAYEEPTLMVVIQAQGIQWYFIVLMSAAIAGGLTFALAGLMSFAARIKGGKWWRNTIIYFVLNTLWKLLKAIGRLFSGVLTRLPEVWKLGLCFLAYLIVDWVLLYAAYENYNNMEALFLFLIFNLAALLLICYIGINFIALEQASKRLASGELDARIDTVRMRFVFKRHADYINAISDGMQIAVDQKLKSERMKTELITNVSHDIKTPVTSIVNYADLLSQQSLPEPAAAYADVVLRQSKRLAKLTEDILEASKASTGNIALDLTRVDVSELISQSAGEYSERLTECGIEAVLNVPERELWALADGRLLWRVADNLLSNVCKYSMPGTRLYIDVRTLGADAVITFKNVSHQPLNIDSAELTERFVRGEAARNSDGSGLGLNIAKSLTELQKGSFDVTVDGDLFKAEIKLKLQA
jgi:signal transduction histidine kinase